MNISRVAVFVAVWAIAALIGYYQDWGMVLAGVIVLPLWLLWIFGTESRPSSGYSGRYGREGRRKQAAKIWGFLITLIGLVLLWWGPQAPWLFNWIAIGVGAVAVIAGFALACRGASKVMGVFAIGVVMMCMGFVPHPDYRYVSPYRAYDYSPYGVKVIEARVKDNQGRSLYGIADRYGAVLEPEYVNFYLLDRRQPFLAIDNGKGVGVYDLERHEVVVPIAEECLKVEQVGDKRYQMVDSTGRAFAEIELPRIYSRDSDDSRIVVKSLSHPSEEPEALLISDGVDRVQTGGFPRRIPAKKDAGDGADGERENDGGSLNLNGPVGENVDEPRGKGAE